MKILQILALSVFCWPFSKEQAATVEVSLPQQKFITEPKDTGVRVGANAILECKIQNRRGEIQWTKDGFGLGLERILEEYPRYSIIGSEEEGNFSLKIENTNIGDDAVYQCQIGAAEGVEGIRSKLARLTVQIKPSEPKIIPGSGVNTTAGSKVELLCETHGGRPEPELSWIDGDGSVVKTKLEKKSWSPEDEKLFHVALKWTLTSESKHDGKLLKCEVKSPALDEKLKAEIPIFVKYKPEVLLKVGSSKINEFEDVTFTCETKAANPRNVFYNWFKDTEVLYGAYTENYTIMKITREYNKKDISCAVGNTVGITKQTHKLNILYPPSSILDVKYQAVSLGAPFKLVCDLDGNPKPTYSWTLRGVTVEREKELKIKAAAIDNVGRYTCKAAVLGYTEARSDVIVLMKGPPSIKEDSPQFAFEGYDIKIECEIFSVPFPTRVEWSKGQKVFDDQISESYEIVQRNITNGITSTLIIRDPLDSDYGQYNCTAYNALGDTSSVIWLSKRKKYLTLIIMGGVIGGVVLVVTFTIAIIFFLRTKSLLKDEDYKTNNSKSVKSSSIWSSETESSFKGDKSEFSTSSESSTNSTDGYSLQSLDTYSETYSRRNTLYDEHQDIIVEEDISRYPRHQLNTFPSRNRNFQAVNQTEFDRNSFNFSRHPSSWYNSDSFVQNNYLDPERRYVSTEGIIRTLENYELPNVTTLRKDYITERNEEPRRRSATHV